jgi:uroporphyrinogen III methyltransferase/synthase
MNWGKVFLIGAGPGDPKLITVRGLEALRKADAIVYDRLANPRLLRHARRDAQKIFVGKVPDKHMMKQDDINRLLVELAMEGKTVARLKGGDPSVFGRVGEEAEALAERGIEFEIIPGVTSAIAVPAYAGIPVTHRDFTSSFSIVTGHEYPNKTYSSVNWRHLAEASGTLIFLMGVANIDNIASELIRWGKPADTPVALIRWGTWVEQRTLTGTLGTIAERVRATGFESPAVIIVGDVVKLREKISWFERKPLFGKRILVTRARSQASGLAERIDELGGEAVEFPVIDIRPPSDDRIVRELDAALARLAEFDWVIFTSVNGVEYFFGRLRQLRIDIRSLHRAKIVAVGPKTAEALGERGLIADTIAAEYRQEGIADALLPQLTPGQKALLPTSNIARDVLPDRLRERGIETTVVAVYENVPSAEYGEEVLELLRQRAIHIVTFTSSSTVKNFVQALRELGADDPPALLEGVDIACIGPVTARTAEEAGLKVDYVAEEATIEALVRAMAASRQ